MKKATLIILLLLCLHSTTKVFSQPPMMGWSSWNANGLNINESLIKETADFAVSLGLKNVGYTWINIDDGFFNGRDSRGNLQVNSKFPNGMKTLADYIRSKGLNPGIYSEIGENTCGHSSENDQGGIGAGLYGYEEQDLRLFFNTWGYDFIKVDYCGAIRQGLDEQTTYTNVSDIIKKIAQESGRTLRYNICRWAFPGTWAKDVADSWRISADITNDFNSIKNIIELNTYLAPYASWGKYNDMDMLQVGRALNVDEEKTHFGMWAIMNSPLMIGCNLRGMRQSSLDILKNEEIIAINQDALGLQAEIISKKGLSMVYAKPIEEVHGTVRAVALYNAESVARLIRVSFKDIQLSGKALVRDLWSHRDLGEFTDYYETVVPAHGTAMLRIKGEYVVDKVRYQGEYAYINKYSAFKQGNNARFEKKGDTITSGGHILSWLGNNVDNWAEYRDVHVSTAGKYTFRLYYLSAEDRDLSVIVNGNTYVMKNLNSGSWNTRRSVDIEIELNQGSNVIRLANDTGWAPNVDKFELIPEGGSIDEDDFDIIDTDGQFPVISSEDGTDETWYYLLFKDGGGALQDMGEGELLLTKSLEEQNTSQWWKVSLMTNYTGDHKYRIINKSGRSLARMEVSETADGFYVATSNKSTWENFKIMPTENNSLSPAWEIERAGASGRCLNQYNPSGISDFDKKISEWSTGASGNVLMFIPVDILSNIPHKSEQKTKILRKNNMLNIEGSNILNVSLYTVNGQLYCRKRTSPFSFLLPDSGFYLVVVKYNGNETEVIRIA